MKIKTAIRILERRTTIPDDEFAFHEIMEAIDMAIDALRQIDKEEEEDDRYVRI